MHIALRRHRQHITRTFASIVIFTLVFQPGVVAFFGAQRLINPAHAQETIVDEKTLSDTTATPTPSDQVQTDTTAAGAPTTTTTDNPVPPLDTTPPIVSVTTPVADAVISGPVTLTADATDDIGIFGVQFQLNGSNIGDPIFTPPYTLDWDGSSYCNGEHAIVALAQDTSENVTVSEPIHVMIENEVQVSNCNDATIHNTGSADSNTGHNSTTGHSDGNPTRIITGDANSGVIVPSQVNTNVTDVTSPVSGSDITVNNENIANLDNTVTATANSGANNSSDNRFGWITTGDTNVSTAVVNTVNTNFTGSSFGNLVRNITDIFTGNINLYEAMLALFDGNNASGFLPMDVNVNNTSIGSINNTVNIDASSGHNTANNTRIDPATGLPDYHDGQREADIVTGNVNIATSVVNLLNTNIIGSNWLFSTINIFGTLVGDIILPGEGVFESLFGDTSHTIEVQNQNTAGVLNALNVNGVTGNNNTSQSRDGSTISTGSVTQQTSVYTQANTNIVDTNFYSFTPHIFGNWQGYETNPFASYLGRGQSEDPSSTLEVDNTNDANITNTINVNASSGDNTATGNRHATVVTGDVNVATNLVNVANTNLVGSNWFLGNLNLFGNWHGNIVYAYPDLAIGDDHPVSAKPGETFTYAVGFSNQGLARARNVRLFDLLPANTRFVSASNGGTEENGQVVWNIGTVQQNSPVTTVFLTVQVNPDLPVGETMLTNVAAVVTAATEPQTSNNTIASTTSVVVVPPPPPPAPPEVPATPSMKIVKFNSATGSVAQGSTVAYGIDVTNTGNVPLQNILVHDRLPDGKGGTLFAKEFPLDDLAPGLTMKITYSLTVAAATADGIYTNTATAEAKYNGVPLASVMAISNVQVKQAATPPPPPPAAAKASTPAPAVKKGAGLVVTHTIMAKPPVRPGAKVDFRITLKNDTDSALTDVIVADTIANNKKQTSKWNAKKIGKGETISLTFSLTLAGNAVGGKYVSTVSATGINVAKKKIQSKDVTASFQVVQAKTLSKTSPTPAKSFSLGVVKRSGNNGLLFSDAQGSPVSAYQYATANKLSLVDVLRDSRDPADLEFVRTYQSGLRLVGKRGKNGKIITVQLVLNDLRKSTQFSSIFGTLSLARK